MNLLLLQPQDFCGENLAVIRGRRFTHLRKIIKADVGHRLPAGLVNGQMGHATVTAKHRDGYTFSVQLDRAPPEAKNCSLLLALPRPLMFKRILQACTSMGVKQIHFTHSDKVEKSFWNSSDLQPAVIDEQLCLGLEQGMDTLWPEVSFHRSFRSLMEQTLPSLLNHSSRPETGSPKNRLLLASAHAQQPCPANVQLPYWLAIGPEGGFTPTEEQAFMALGFEAVQLGARTLRVETAISALLGRTLPC